MSGTPDVSIVLPVYNQADHIGGIVQDYQAALANLKSSVELILVVNGNRDGSLDCCRELEKTHGEVRALHEQEPGWGRAVRKGLAAAEGKLLCYTNSARTSAYHLVLHMMLGLANTELVVKANRRLRHPVARRIGSVLYNVECRTFFDLPVWDVNGTPKVFGRDILARLNLQEDGDLIDLEFVLRCRQLGLQILEVPIVSSVRHGGESTTNVISAFRMYWGAARMWYHSSSENQADKGPNAR